MRLINLIAVCVLFILLTSCRQRRYLYASSKINTPALQKKGDSRLNASYSFGSAKGFGDSSKNRGYDIQGAIALTDHFALMGSYSARKEADRLDLGSYFGIDFTESYVRYRRNMAEAGIGYFTQVHRNTNVSIYGGVAFGGMHIDDTGLIDSVAYSRFFHTDVRRYFLQPGITFFNRKKGSFDLSVRITYLQNQTTGTNYSSRELTYFSLKPVGGKSTAVFLEPSFNFQFALFGTDWLRAETSLAFLNRNSSSAGVRGWNLSLGFTLDPLKAFKQ